MTGAGVLVLGGGVAGFALVRGLRERGYAGRITIVDPAGYPHDRPPLSKEFLTGAMTAEQALLAPASWYADNAVDVRTDRAERIAAEELAVTFDSGTRRAADAIVLATGAVPRRPAIHGVDDARVLTLRTLADAAALRSLLTRGAHLAVLGAGLIGAEVASAATALGARATLVDPAPVPLVPALGPRIARALHAMHAAHDVACVTAMPTAVEHPDDRSVRIRLDDGGQVDADAVLLALGVDPYSALGASAGLDQDDGIVVDDAGRTSREGIWAIGDVARTRQADGTLVRRAEHWDSAIRQGAASAAAICGAEPPAPAVPWFWSDRYGVHAEAVGTMSAPGTHIERAERGGLVVFNVSDAGRLLGAAAIDAGMAVRAARRIIERGTAVVPEQLADPAVNLRKLAR